MPDPTQQPPVERQPDDATPVDLVLDTLGNGVKKALEATGTVFGFCLVLYEPDAPDEVAYVGDGQAGQMQSALEATIDELGKDEQSAIVQP